MSVPVVYTEVITFLAVVGVLIGIISRRAAAAQPHTQTQAA